MTLKVKQYIPSMDATFTGASSVIKTINNTLMKPMSELYTRTLERKTFLQSTCTKFVEMWECEWKAVVKNLPEDMKRGRTNATPLFHQTSGDEVNNYLDVCSLYPFSNKYCSYPLYHPEIITKNFKDVSVSTVLSNVTFSLRKIYTTLCSLIDWEAS